MGALYYQVARANGGSLLQSTLFDIGASTRGRSASSTARS